MIEIVKTAIIYRINKNPIKKEEIVALNKLIADVGFKIPELWDNSFLNGLPSEKQNKAAQQPKNNQNLVALKQEYIDLAKLQPHERGYAFQDFLNKLFSAYALAPLSAFRLTGEEIDGSFELMSDTYLLEAKWQKAAVSQKDLAAFSIKISGKSTWSRGLCISYSGFTAEGLEAFDRGKQTNIIGMDGQDIFFILDGKMKLDEAIKAKARFAAETNNLFASVFDLSNRYDDK